MELETQHRIGLAGTSRLHSLPDGWSLNSRRLLAVTGRSVGCRLPRVLNVYHMLLAAMPQAGEVLARAVPGW